MTVDPNRAGGVLRIQRQNVLLL